MISLTCGAEDTWTKWAWFSGVFAAGVSASTNSTVEYCPNDRYNRPTSGDARVVIYTWTAKDAKLVTPPNPGGWYHIGVDTGDYTDDADVFMAG